MRIIHVINGLDPEIGGPAAVAARLAAVQAARGNDVAVVTTRRSRPFFEYKQDIGFVPGLDKVRVVEVDGSSRAAQYSIRSLLDDSGARTVMHLHGVWCRILLQAARVARDRHVPYVVVPHGMLDPWSMAQKRWKKMIGLWLGRKRLLEGAGFLHVLNRDEAELLEPIAIRVPRVVLPNGMFSTEVGRRAERGRFYARYPVLDSKPYILFLNRLHYKKGLDYLAKIFSVVAEKNPDVRLVVVGPDYGAQNDFEQAVRKFDLVERVLIPGPMYGDAKLEALTDAACFCLPSRQEGFSMAIIEALSVGCPVVISENCHFPEVRQSRSGFVLPLEIERFAAAVLRILDDSRLRTDMGKAGEALIAGSFTWERIAERTELAYSDLFP